VPPKVSIEANKALVRRLVEDVVNERDEGALEEVATGELAAAARTWIGPFREAFPDFRMDIVRLVAEGDTVVAHFKCSGTHRGPWRGREPTGRSFTAIDEIYVFEVVDGRLAAATGVEDNLTRMKQLEFEL
jgi:predicted ester cyclase